MSTHHRPLSGPGRPRRHLLLKARLAMAAVICLSVVTGCTTLTATQNQCLDSYQAFPDQAACIRQSVAGNRALRDDTLVQEYVLTADDLAAKVKAGQLSDAEARLRLTEKLNNVRERDIAEQANQAELFAGHGPNTPAYIDGAVRAIPRCTSSSPTLPTAAPTPTAAPASRRAMMGRAPRRGHGASPARNGWR